MRPNPLIVLCTILIFIGGCAGTGQNQSIRDQASQRTIATTFFPLYSLTTAIAGENANVFSLIPAGAEPHDYEATPQDIQKLNAADAYVTMGVEFSAAEDTLVQSLKKEIIVIPAGKGIIQISSSENQQGRDESTFGGKDPHVWLSPKNAKIMAGNIRDALVAMDEEHAVDYGKNADALLAELDRLDEEFRSGLSSCKKNTVLVNHNAFTYLGKEYGFTTITISGLEPEAEPSPGQIKNLIDTARKNDIKYILYESLVDPRVAETIAQEVGAQVLELNPLEGTTDPNATYVSLMRKNLQTLRIALECQ